MTGSTDPSTADPFQAARARLTGRAYRVLGSFSDADDVVQEAWLRWHGADRSTIDNADAWLNTVVTRLAIDRLRQRKRDEERYTGPWLPTPLIERAADPAEVAELSDSMTTAFLTMLEELSPDERAAFLMADVFGDPFAQIADSMDRSVESCRQLASRARRKLRAAGEHRRDDRRAAAAVIERFVTALVTGDESGALACVAPDVVTIHDGGPNRRAARYPVRGADRVVRMYLNLFGRATEAWAIAPALVGGLPGLVIEEDGKVFSVTAIEVVDGVIVRSTSVLNPDKLAAATGRDRTTLA